MIVLVVNAGSSSLKLSLIDSGEGGERRLRRAEATAVDDHHAAFSSLRASLDGAPKPEAIGHRIVHGGAAHVAPALVSTALLDDLRALVPLAPLHLPAELSLVEAALDAFPALPEVACFDTAFHRRMPGRAERFPLLAELFEAGVRRYGFHGLSYEFVVEALGPALAPRTVVAHLGSGASMVALTDGVSVDTTMGLTPVGGLMMATRSGDLDPGVLIHLQRTSGLNANALEDLVVRRSGLLGVSGLSAEMRVLLERRREHAGAALAVEMFVYQARKTIGALAAALGGLDLLVFTGGIGEHAYEIRAEICAGLRHLGVVLDSGRNAEHAPVVTTDGSSCAVRVVSTDEERMVARHACRLVG